MRVFLVAILILLFGCTVSKPGTNPCETLAHTLYQQNHIVYWACEPIKILPETDSLNEIFIFDLSKPEGKKRLFWDTVLGNKQFKINLEKLASKPYWFVYRILGRKNIELAQFTF